jgi:hypothetical protein
MGGALVVSLTSGLEKVPAGCSHNESTSDTHDGQGNAEELKHIGANEH